jgi:serine/threonine protein kinase/WD40 repeat protein
VLLMRQWSITLHGPIGILSSVDTGESQFVVGTETASDVFTVQGDGVTGRHAWVWIGEAGLQVEDLGGGTQVNGYQINERVQVDYPASVQVGEVTLVIELKSVQPVAVAPTPSSLDITIPQRAVTKSKASMEVTIPQRTPTRSSVQKTASTVSPSAPSADEASTHCKYTLVREIARGGMGQIYFGEDPQLKRNVAVKVSSVSEAGEDPRFSKEAEVLAQLAHPNIVPIYNIGVDAQSRPFYSMKLIKGRTLQAVLNLIQDGDASSAKDYPRTTLLTIFRKVCDAMMFAHSKGILHRDLKPENIMVGEYGEVLVMDWGLAKVLGEREERGSSVLRVNDTGDYGMTMEGEVMGTPQYMSPEQAMGMVAELDARSDIYSLGGILYAILTLRPPIEGTTLDEVLTKVKNGSISSMVTKRGGKGSATMNAPSTMGAEVPGALQAVTLKAMAMDRTKRYSTVEAFASDIDAYQNGFATLAEDAGFAKQIMLLVKRNKAVSAMCGLLFAGAVVFSLRLIASERQAVQERMAAQVSSAKAKIALAQSEDQAKNPQEMRRILDEVPREFRDQHWSYLDAKLAPPTISFEVPQTPVEVAFPSSRSPGCFLTIQRDGNVRYLDPSAGFGSPLFRLPDPVKDLALAFYEEEGRMWLAVVSNRSTRLRDKTYPASLEMLDVPSGKSVYKVGVELPCASVDFSPQGNLLCLRRRPPAPNTLQMRNAYSAEIIWEGGEKDTVSSKCSPDEQRLVCVIERKGFQDLDPWTGKALGPYRNAPGRAGVWRPTADRVYAIWNWTDRAYVRAFDTKEGAVAFEHPLPYPGARISSSGGGQRLYIASSPSSEGRIVELLEATAGSPKQKAYLLGNYNKFLAHMDDIHVLCLGDKKAAFLQWDFPKSLVADLPRFDGPIAFMDGDSKVAACTPRNDKTAFKIFDLTKPKGEAGAAFSVLVRGQVFTNRARDLFSFMDDARRDECVIARVDAKGIRQVSRWKASSTPQLSPSGERAWTKEGLYEATTGKLLQKYERKDLGWPVWVQWLDEKRVLELVSVKRKTEGDDDEFSENAYVLWEADTGRILFKALEPSARTFGVSPDGLWIAEGGVDGRLRIRSAQTLEVHKDYKVHDSWVRRAVWHPTKPVIVTCSGDFYVRAWDVRDGKMVQSYRCWDFPRNIDVSMDGKQLCIGIIGVSQILSLDLGNVRN